MNRITVLRGLILGVVFGWATTPALAVTNLTIADLPLFLGNSVEPDVMVMLDNSGSMKNAMYKSGSSLVAFDPNKSYFGIFDSTKHYEYDDTIPVDTNAYSAPIDPAVAGAFVETGCTPSASNDTCWDGKFLNWLTTRRIDATRMVLVGGKVENRGGFDYLGNGIPHYKIVGNNGRSDPDFSAAYASSADLSPIPNDQTISVHSPALSGSIKSAYKPYGQIKYGGDEGFLFDDSGSTIGEFGQATVQTTVDASKNLLASSWTQVTFQHSYSVAPVVVARPPSYNGSDPGVVRIRNVTTTDFEIAFQEWPYKDGNHTTETIPYLVVEPGSHTLSGGLELDAGTTSTDESYQTLCPGSNSQTSTVGFNTVFGSTPVVLTSVVSFNEADTVNSRVKSVFTSSFTVALQEQENGNSHASEDIAWVAIEKGQVADASLPFYLEVGSVSSVTDATKTINFTTAFPGPPAFLAAMQTINGPNSAALRTKSVAADAAKLFVEEEQSCDSELSHTGAEEVGYVSVLNGAGTLNIAVVASALSEGILQKVKNKVRLGVSFYRYDPDINDIYNGNKINGGTLKFKIPFNPFVKKPTDANLSASEQGYRELTGYIGTPIDDIVDSIEHYPLVWGTTPIAENLWEVIQYFEQDPNGPHYPAVTSGFEDFDLADAGNPERDPYYHPTYGEKMECIRSNVLIFTDGFPFKDAGIPSNILNYDGDGKLASGACTDNANREKDCADETDPNSWGHDNLDDVGYWAYCDKSQGSCIDPNTGKAVTPSRDLRTDIINDQFLRIDTVGFAGGTIRPILQDTADNAGGTAYAAADGLALADALGTIFAKITTSSAASVAVNSGSIQSNSKLFLARFNSDEWAGNLLAFKINADGSLAHSLDANGLMIPDASGWLASLPAANSRVILTYDGTTGKPFRWSNASDPQATLSAAQKNLLDPANANNPSSPVLDWLRGDQSSEQSNGGAFRDRTTVLGDIIHSTPVFVGAPIAFQYPDDMEGLNNLYSTFRAAQANRTPMVYVGGNDGMLHAFDAVSGTEKFAYVPNTTLGLLPVLTDPNYSHKYTVDGSPTLIDAFFGSAWHTVLAAGLRSGGQGVYALDVTDPADFSTEAGGAAKVLWEFTDSSGGGHPDLGFTFSRPNVVRLHSGVWAAVFGNGYNNTDANDTNVSATGNAVLYVVNLETGALIHKFDTGVGFSDSASGGRPNGLATASAVDVDADAVLDYVYGGDLYGNLWKFDLTDTDPANWDKALLFTACTTDPCTDTNRQPITVRPEVGRHPTGTGFLVYFGTGQYFEDGDNVSVGQPTQTFYGIWDKNSFPLPSIGRNNLKQRKILEETSDFGFNLRITSGSDDDPADGGGAIDWTTDLGWSMDLINTEGGNTDNMGERVVRDPVFRSGKIIFTTLIPSDDPCDSGGTGWLMEIDAAQGTRLNNTPFDVNHDGTFTSSDFTAVNFDINGDGTVDADDTAPVSGIQSTVGIMTSPGITTSQAGDKEYKYNSGSTGNIQVTAEQPGSARAGRLSWRQIFSD